MGERPLRGISREGLDEAFEAEEIRKSNLILEAHLLRDLQRVDEAAAKLAEAAPIEERLGAECEAKGLLEKSWVHRYSAACCWAKAGNLLRAIALADELLARNDLPDRLRQSIHDYVRSLRSRRAQWTLEDASAKAAG
jgi:hypothetical protein